MDMALEVKGLCKSYADFSLKDVSFSLPKGAIMGFIGQNGAGKTTTIKAILNITGRSAGDIKIMGLDNLKDEYAAKEKIGVVFDDLCFHDTLNIKHINKIFKGVYKSWDEEIFYKYIKRFSLPSKKKVKELSRGMRMKLSIAAALSHNAKLLLLDEPTSGLDPIVRNEILDVFMEYVQDEENSILLSSHIISDLEKIADYITFIDDGRILLADSKDSILDNHKMIKCGEAEISQIEKTDIVFIKKYNYYCEVLVKNAAHKYVNLTEEKAGIEDIMLFYASAGKGAEDAGSHLKRFICD